MLTIDCTTVSATSTTIWTASSARNSADLHDDQLGEVQMLVEREQRQAEQARVEEGSGGVAGDEEQRLPRVADHGPDAYDAKDADTVYEPIDPES